MLSVAAIPPDFLDHMTIILRSHCHKVFQQNQCLLF